MRGWCHLHPVEWFGLGLSSLQRGCWRGGFHDSEVLRQESVGEWRRCRANGNRDLAKVVLEREREWSGERSVRCDHGDERACGDGLHGSGASRSSRQKWKLEKFGGSSSRWGAGGSAGETDSERGSCKEIS